jgi:DNA-directed RNA polymerase specialized sigma24 family protein
MISVPPFDTVLDQALAGQQNDDVRIFYEYFDALKGKVRAKATKKVKAAVGESAVVQSAIFSLFEDIRIAGIPMNERDDAGRPMLWPLLLRYLERHCDKWNKYYKIRAEQGFGGTESQAGFDPVDPQGDVLSEASVVAICESLAASMTAQEVAVFESWVDGHTLEQSAAEVGCSEAKVSYLRKRIRDSLTSL